MNIQREIGLGAFMILAGALLLASTTSVQAAYDYTGCLVVDGGTINSVAPGPSPLRPCRAPREAIIHIDGRIPKQTFDVHWNPLVVCDALRQLDFGNDNADIDAQLLAMGCPSAPDLPAPSAQPLVRVGLSTAFGDNLDALDCGILKIENREDWGKGWHWVVDGGTTQSPEGPPGGVVQFHKRLVVQTAPEDCEALCRGDDKCIAAFMDKGLRSGNEVFWECHTFHYNDNVGEPWHNLCGATATGGLGCTNTSNVNDWWIRDCTAVPP
jgi:hypothetical protein